MLASLHGPCLAEVQTRYCSMTRVVAGAGGGAWKGKWLSCRIQASQWGKHERAGTGAVTVASRRKIHDESINKYLT